MGITNYHQSYNNFDSYKRAIISRSEYFHEERFPSKRSSIHYHQKPSRYQLLQDKKVVYRYNMRNVDNLRNLQHYSNRRKMIAITWKSIKNNKKLNSTNMNLFMNTIYYLRGRYNFTTKLSFKNYLAANRPLQEDLVSEFNKTLWRYITRYASILNRTEIFHPKRFLVFCYRTLETKPLVDYEEINEPLDFYINSELQDDTLLSEKSFEIFISELQNAKYNKDLAKFYSKRNRKIKKKIK